MGLAPIEEGVPKSLPSVIVFEDRLAKIHDAVRGSSRGFEGPFDPIILRIEGRGCSSTYELVSIKNRHKAGLRMLAKDLDVREVCLYLPLVQIGPFRKDLDTEFRNVC